MTNKEALRRVKGYLTDCLPADCYEEVEEIMEALEQQSCEDAISREAVIDALYDMETLKYRIDLENVIKALPPVIPKTKWIPISERLPNYDECIKNNGLFNVSDGNRTYTEWFDIYDKQRFGEFTMDGFRVDYAVTAWMPLPELYKPQESK